jgi:hypothetical protein
MKKVNIIALALLLSCGAAAYSLQTSIDVIGELRELIAGDDDPPPQSGGNPVAIIEADRSVARVGEAVNFSATGSDLQGGVLVRYVWNFGDGSELTGVNDTVSYTWSSSSIFTVSLQIEMLNASSATDEVMVTVKPQDYSYELNGGARIAPTPGASLQTRREFPVEEMVERIELNFIVVPEDYSLHYNVTFEVRNGAEELIFEKTVNGYLQQSVNESASFTGSDEAVAGKYGNFEITVIIRSDPTVATEFEWFIPILVLY